MVHLLAVEKLLEGSAGGRVVELPDGGRVDAGGTGWSLSLKKIEKAAVKLYSRDVALVFERIGNLNC